MGTGIFTIYFKRDSIFLSLLPDQLDHDYLLVTQISQGIGELGLDGGTLGSVRPGPLPPRGRPGRALGREPALRRRRRARRWPAPSAYSFGHSVAQSFPIAADAGQRARSWSNVAPFLLSDWADVGTVFQNAAAQRKLTGNDLPRRQALQPPAAAALPRQPRGGGPPHLPDAPEPRARDRRRLPLDPDRHPLLPARAASHADASALRRRPGRATSSPRSRTSRATPPRASSSAT